MSSPISSKDLIAIGAEKTTDLRESMVMCTRSLVNKLISMLKVILGENLRTLPENLALLSKSLGVA